MPGSSAVGISCPASATKLAVPIPATPGLSHRSGTSVVSAASACGGWRAPLCGRAAMTTWNEGRLHVSGEVSGLLGMRSCVRRRTSGWAGRSRNEVLVSDPAEFQVITVGGENGEVVVYLVGDLDLAARDRLVEALTEASATTRRLVIDLSRTTFIDSTGVKALVDVWRRREDAGRDLVLREPAPVVMRTLEMAGVAHLLPIDLGDGSTR